MVAGGPFASRAPTFKQFVDPPPVRVDPVGVVGITVALSRRFRVRRTVSRRSSTLDAAVGQAFVYAPGSAVDVRAEGECRLMQMHLPLSRLAHIALEDHDADLAPDALMSLAGDVDPRLLAALARNQTGVVAREETDRLVVARLVDRHRGLRAVLPTSGGLAPARLRRVRDLVEEDLAGADLATMAGAAALSPYHFARAFRISVGTSPSRYLAERRICRALTLLAETEGTIADVALAAGFCSASHMVQQVRLRSGTTPGRLRSALLGLR